MKNKLFIFLFIFFLLTQGYYVLYRKEIGETKLSYERVLGTTPDVVTKMNVGYRNHNGWEFTTRDKDLIHQVFIFLNSKQFIQQNVVPTSGSGTNHPHYSIHFLVTEKKTYWISFSISADDGTSVWVDGKHYKMTNSSSEKGKDFFESLKSKWKQTQQTRISLLEREYI